MKLFCARSCVAVGVVTLLNTPIQAYAVTIEKGKSYRLTRSVYTLTGDEDVPAGSTIEEQRLIWRVKELETRLIQLEASLSEAKAGKAGDEKVKQLQAELEQERSALEAAKGDKAKAEDRRKALRKAEQQLVTAEKEMAKATETLAAAAATPDPKALQNAQQQAASAVQELAAAKKELEDAQAANDALSVYLTSYAAASGSKFVVETIPKEGGYVIKMDTVYTWDEMLPDRVDWAQNETSYRLPKQIGSTPLEDVIVETKTGAVSGPLVVPFKWHFDGDDLGGEATIGAYAGYSFAVGGATCTVICTNVVPFLSAGLSQVSVANDATGEDDTKSAMTLAVGTMITSWGGLNLGVVVGWDWTGEDTYDHEGETWTSFSIGWDFAGDKSE